jgi:hypothetical protein
LSKLRENFGGLNPQPPPPSGYASDANKTFLTVDVRQYGRVSDGNVFAKINNARCLARQNIDLPSDKNLGGVVIGD